MLAQGVLCGQTAGSSTTGKRHHAIAIAVVAIIVHIMKAVSYGILHMASNGIWQAVLLLARGIMPFSTSL